jgi:hypothetical protein
MKDHNICISQESARKFANDKTQEIMPQNCRCGGWKFFASQARLGTDVNCGAAAYAAQSFHWRDFAPANRPPFGKTSTIPTTHQKVAGFALESVADSLRNQRTVSPVYAVKSQLLYHLS